MYLWIYFFMKMILRKTFSKIVHEWIYRAMMWFSILMLFSLIVFTPVHILTTKSTKPICFISLLLEYSWFWTGRQQIHTWHFQIFYCYSESNIEFQSLVERYVIVLVWFETDGYENCFFFLEKKFLLCFLISVVVVVRTLKS